MELIKEFGLAFLQAFLGYVLPALAAALAGLVIVWMNKLIQKAKVGLSAETFELLKSAAKAAVLAAEQVGLADKLVEKKEYALDFAEGYLLDRGIKFDFSTLSDLIEAAVMEEFNRSKLDWEELSSAVEN